MKIRTDFVTNSSSSSFVVVFADPPELDAETKAKYPELQSYLDLFHKIIGKGAKIVNNSEQFKEHMKEEFGYDDIDECTWADYDYCFKALEAGYNIAVFSVSSENDPASYMHDILANTQIVQNVFTNDY